MSACCCSLAGTPACRTCPNNPYADLTGANKFYVTRDTAEMRIEPYIVTTMPKVNKNLVEVVRCGDCVYMQCNIRQDGYLPRGVDEYECRHWCGSCDPTDFCSYGRKMSDEKGTCD